MVEASSIEIFVGGKPLGAAVESMSFEPSARAAEEVVPVARGLAGWSVEPQTTAAGFDRLREALSELVKVPPWPLRSTLSCGILGEVTLPSRAVAEDGAVLIEAQRAPLEQAIERLIVTESYAEGARVDLEAATPLVRAMSRQILGRAYRGERQRRRAMRRLLRAMREA